MNPRESALDQLDGAMNVSQWCEQFFEIENGQEGVAPMGWNRDGGC